MDAKKSSIEWKHPSLINPNGSAYPWIVLAVITLLLILSMFAVVTTAVADPVIQGAFSLSSSALTWVNTSVLLSLAVTVPVGQFLAEKKGFKLILFLGAFIFTLGMFLSAISQSLFFLIISRMITGFGTGFFVPISIAVIAKAFRPNQMPLALAIYSALGFGGGLAIAFLLGGYLAEYFSWHWIFLLSAFFGLPCIPCIWLILQETDPQDKGRFDFGGFVTYALWIASFIIIISTGKAPWNTEGWHSNFMKFFYLNFVINLILFVFIELHQPQPLFNVRLLKIRPFVLGCILLFFVGAVYFASAQSLPGLFQDYLSYSKFKSGLYMIPHGLFLGLSSAALGLVLNKTGIRIPLLLGCVILSTSCFMQNFLSIYSDHKFIISMLVLRGLGVGMTIGPVTALALIRVDKKDIANASMIVTLFRQIGASSATSLVGVFEVTRGAFHQARFMEQIGQKTPEYYRSLNQVKTHIYSQLGENSQGALEQAQGQIINVVNKQAMLAGANDGYLILGVALLSITSIVAFFMIRARLREMRMNPHLKNPSK
ncbi:MAG: DHA2 family efflux MFS transporter permease subunit [Simkaniaceae bacterium]|nr:DHA2 family efflux MFS transporter permease subunit [Simkaniaceae bacterium]